MIADLPNSHTLAAPLLGTRFFLPQLSSATVPRIHLMERLEQGLQVPLTLISAPPGFGKSSVVSQWIRKQAEMDAVWLSLERSDQDWSIFFRYLVAAWQRIFPQIGGSALERLNDPPPLRKELILNQLLNDLLRCMEGSVKKHALLVLDDYHHIETTLIHETVQYLAEHLPPRCHLIILTRADPPLPLARWRSRGLLLELRADDLRFTAAESAEYLNHSLRLALTEPQVRILFERTEGWVVGLQMAALSLQAYKDTGKNAQVFLNEFDGSSRFVLDYLVEEVVNGQPEAVQQFLMVTALFEKFCSPLCDALLDASPPSSQRMLEQLEKANLFLIPLDDHRQWYRYHHLFAELLRLRMLQTNPGQVLTFYRRGAEWFLQNGLWRDAVRYALQTRDLDFSADLFEQVILKGGMAFLTGGIGPLIEAFPTAIVQSRPLLSLAKAVAIFDTSQLEGIEPLLRLAEQGIVAAPPFAGQEDVLGWIYVFQSNAATLLGDHAWVVEATHQMTKWIPEDFVTKIEAWVQLGLNTYYEGNLNQAEVYWQEALDLSLANSNTYYILMMLNGLALLCNQKGELNRAEMFFRKAFGLLSEHSGQFLRWLGAMQRDYSDLLRDLNRLDEARALIVTALPLLEKWHTINALGYGFLSAARIQYALGDLPGAHAILNKVDELRLKYNLYPNLETLSEVTRARVSLEEGQTEQAWQILEACLNSSSCQYLIHREWVSIVQARILIQTGRPAEALGLLAGCLESAKANGRGRNGLTIGLLMSLAHNSLGDRQQAYDLLADALVFSRMQDYRRPFIEEGEPMRALLEDFRIQFPRTLHGDHLVGILSLFPAPPAAGSRMVTRVEGLQEALSPRELEILRLLCQGLSNREIADQLVLSVGTVKFHIHNIYRKLAVRDRPQAIAKASLSWQVNKDRTGSL